MSHLKKKIMIEYLVIIIIWIPLQSYRWLLSVAYTSEPDLSKFLDLFKNQLNSNLSNAMAAGSAGNGTDPETEIRSQRVFLMLQYQKKTSERIAIFSLSEFSLSFILYKTSTPGMEVVAEGTQGLGRQSFVGLLLSSPSASGSSNCVRVLCQAAKKHKHPISLIFHVKL